MGKELESCPFCESEDVNPFHNSGHDIGCFMNNVEVKPCTPCCSDFEQQWNTRSLTENNPAISAISFALETDDGLTFLRLWNEGEFDGADPLFKNQGN